MPVPQMTLSWAAFGGGPHCSPKQYHRHETMDSQAAGSLLLNFRHIYLRQRPLHGNSAG